ncbi:unknown [Prevotella sp. CAG:1185]|nr:unknown [Prevotella sp. CAG:1185]
MKHLITLLLAVLATANVTAQDVVYPGNMEYLQMQVIL